MNRYFLVMAAAFPITVSAAEPTAKMTQAEAEAFVFHRWREESVVEAGQPGRVGMCFRFAADGGVSWCWQGELGISGPTPGQRIVIDANAEPMRIDFYVPDADGKLKYVLPCIWKVEGKGKEAKLVIAAPDGSEKPREKDDYSDSQVRPTEFESTKANKSTTTVYVPCDLWEQIGDRPRNR